MGDDNGRRELGAILARLNAAEDEIERLRAAKHDHANRITGVSHAPLMLKDLDIRVDALEGWKERVYAVASTLGLLFGAVGAFLMERIFGQ